MNAVLALGALQDAFPVLTDELATMLVWIAAMMPLLATMLRVRLDVDALSVMVSVGNNFELPVRGTPLVTLLVVASVALTIPVQRRCTRMSPRGTILRLLQHQPSRRVRQHQDESEALRQEGASLRLPVPASWQVRLRAREMRAGVSQR